MKKLSLIGVIGLAAVLLLLSLLVGCGDGDEAAKVSTADETAATTATLSASPPCFGLVQADKLPDWAGGLAFGEIHSFGGGSTDLRSVVGCEVEGGVIVINEDGRFFHAYVDDCECFESSDIPPQELRPAGDDRWICFQPTGDGGIGIMQREGTSLTPCASDADAPSTEAPLPTAIPGAISASEASYTTNPPSPTPEQTEVITQVEEPTSPEPEPSYTTNPPSPTPEQTDNSQVVIALSPGKYEKPLGLDVVAGDYKLVSGTELWTGSSISVYEDWLTFPPGLVIQVEDGSITLKGKIYTSGTKLIVNQDGLILPSSVVPALEEEGCIETTSDPSQISSSGPPPVCGYHGSVTIDGADVPDGTPVTASIDGITVVTTTTDGTQYRIIVAGEFDGKCVRFVVDNSASTESVPWERGENLYLDLRAVTNH